MLGEKPAVITVRLTQEERAELRMEAALRDVSMSDIVREAIKVEIAKGKESRNS